MSFKKRTNSLSDSPNFQIYKSLKNLTKEKKSTPPHPLIPPTKHFRVFSAHEAVVERAEKNAKMKKSENTAKLRKIDEIFAKSEKFQKNDKNGKSPKFEKKRRENYSMAIESKLSKEIQEDIKNFGEIGNSALDRFREKVSMYNNFFTRFIIEPKNEFSRRDLVVTPFSLFDRERKNDKENSLSPQEKIRRSKFSPSIYSRIQTNKEKKVNEGMIMRLETKNSIFFKRNEKKSIIGRLSTLERIEKTDSFFIDKKKGWLGSYEEAKKKIENAQNVLNQIKERLCINNKTIDAKVIDLCKKNKLDELEELLLTQDVDLNVTDNYFKQTLLHWTAKRGFTDLVSFLLKRNVDTFIRDSSGKTAKDLAEKKGLSEIVKKINLHNEKLELESFQKIPNKKRGQGISSFEKI